MASSQLRTSPRSQATSRAAGQRRDRRQRAGADGWLPRCPSRPGRRPPARRRPAPGCRAALPSPRPRVTARMASPRAAPASERRARAGGRRLTALSCPHHAPGRALAGRVRSRWSPGSVMVATVVARCAAASVARLWARRCRTLPSDCRPRTPAPATRPSRRACVPPLDRLPALPLEAALRIDPTLRDRHDELMLRRFLRDYDRHIEQLARAVATGEDRFVVGLRGDPGAQLSAPARAHERCRHALAGLEEAAVAHRPGRGGRCHPRADGRLGRPPAPPPPTARRPCRQQGRAASSGRAPASATTRSSDDHQVGQVGPVGDERRALLLCHAADRAQPPGDARQRSHAGRDAGGAPRAAQRSASPRPSAIAAEHRDRYAGFIEADGALRGPGFRPAEAARLPEHLRDCRGIVVTAADNGIRRLTAPLEAVIGGLSWHPV